MSDQEDWVLELRSCLTSVKNGIPLSQIDSEFSKLTGTHIPYKHLGFPSLEACLKSTGEFMIRNHAGVSIVHVIASYKTQYLIELIHKQKSKPPKKRNYAYKKANASNSSYQSKYYSKPRSYNNRPINSLYQDSTSNYNNYKSSSSYRNSRSNQYNNYQSNTYDQNNHNKALLQSNLINDDTNNVQSVTVINNTVPPSVPFTRSCSSLESTHNFASYASKPSVTNPMDKFQVQNFKNNTASKIVNIIDKVQIPKNNIYSQEKNTELKTQEHTYYVKIPPSQNMPIKQSAQSRLSKYPKKCNESLNKINAVDGNGTLKNEEFLAEQITDLKIEVNDNRDYIKELETYLKNLNLSDPYYEFMVQKKKFWLTIKFIHICTIKVNNNNICSSFPVECSSRDHAKKVAAKLTLIALKKQYGESVIYPITSDINTMASRIKGFLKQGYEGTGLLSDALELMYRNQFKENLPCNWIPLLEVFSYFMFDKIVDNKLIIYLNEVENNHFNSHESSNGCFIGASIEQNIVPGTSLTLEDYNEKSVFVSAYYGSSNIWIRLVEQNADKTFIQMQAKFNEFMNTSRFSMAEQVIQGEFYAVLYNSSWHRVQICSTIKKDDTVTCLMIDTGEHLIVATDQICHLEPVFMKTKIQAIQCILTQLDYFDEFHDLRELLDEMILYKTFCLVPDTLEEGYLPRVTLYEKKNGEPNRVNINDLIIQRFMEKNISMLPTLKEGDILEATVSSDVESELTRY